MGVVDPSEYNTVNDRPHTDDPVALEAFVALMTIKDNAPGFPKITTLPGEAKSKLARDIGGREGQHLERMLTRPGVERDFATAFNLYNPEKYFRKLHPDLGSMRVDVKRITDGEGYDTTVFWTFAPYLYNYMHGDMEVPDDEVFGLLYSWAHDARDKFKEEDPNSFPQLKVHLAGLEYLNEGNNHIYYLDSDPAHPSHVFTESESRELTSLLLQNFIPSVT